MQKLFAIELVLVLILFTISGESLKCYVCRSDTDDGCNGNMNNSLSQECPEKDNKTVYCRKIHQQLRFRDEKQSTSIRECAYEKGKKGCYIFRWPELAHQETCECDHDNCNRGYIYHPNIMTVTSIFSMLVLNYLKTDLT